jgi:hypothetical protein
MVPGKKTTMYNKRDVGKYFRFGVKLSERRASIISAYSFLSGLAGLGEGVNPTPLPLFFERIVMKCIIVTIAIFALFELLPAKDKALNSIRNDTKFNQYLAGIELLDHSKTLTDSARAEKYRVLCLITGLSADSAAQRVLRFKADPVLWQQVRSSVLELLQKPQ